MTRTEAHREARKRGKLGYPHSVVTYQKHSPVCLYSDGTIIPKYPCTCGGIGAAYTLVLS
jgi:hypothetical protein